MNKKRSNKFVCYGCFKITKEIKNFRCKSCLENLIRKRIEAQKLAEQEKKIRRKAKKAFYQNMRRAAQIKATPKWADLKAIEEIYMMAKKGTHVDHIVPLNGKRVCGLHVEYNLQILPISENCKKSNKF